MPAHIQKKQTLPEAQWKLRLFVAHTRMRSIKRASCKTNNLQIGKPSKKLANFFFLVRD